MSIVEKFSEGEWNMICLAPLDVAILASLADSGLIAQNREIHAFAGAVKEALQEYEGNELIAAVLSGQERDLPKEMRAEVEARKQNPRLKGVIMEELQKAVLIINKKAPSREATDFKRMLYDVADKIVNASGEGFMGTGPKVSEKEALFMKELQKIFEL